MAIASPQDEGSSIFPFLAVLVCAMGALIFLLIALTQKIRDVPDLAVQPKQSLPESVVEAVIMEPVVLPTVDLGEPLLWEPAEDIPEPEVVAEVPPPAWPPAYAAGVTDAPEYDSQPAQQKKRLRQLREQEIAKLQQMLQQSTTQLAAEQEQKRLLEQQVANVDQQHEAHQKQLQRLKESIAESKASVEQQHKAVAEVRQQLVDLQLEYQKALDDQLEVSESTEFIAIDSKTGERRQPIIIECKADEILFQPQGVTLNAQDFIGFNATANPLVIGARYLLQEAAQSSAKTPYILVLVREGGIDSFRLVQTLLSANRFPMGYELVGDEVALHFPRVQSQSADRLALLLEEIRRQQRIVYGNLPGPASGNGTGEKADFSFSTLVSPGSLIEPIEIRSSEKPESALTDLPIPGLNVASRQGQSQQGQLHPGQLQQRPSQQGQRDLAQGQLARGQVAQGESSSMEEQASARKRDPFAQPLPDLQRNSMFDSMESSQTQSNDPRANAFRGIVRKPRLRGMRVGDPVARPQQPIQPKIPEFESRRHPASLSDQELAQLFQTRPSSPSASQPPAETIEKSMPAMAEPQRLEKNNEAQEMTAPSIAAMIPQSLNQRVQASFQPEAGKLVIEQAIDVTLTPRGLSLGGESLPFLSPLPTTQQVQAFLVQQLVEEVESFPKAPDGFQWQPTVEFSIDPTMDDVGAALMQMCRELDIPFTESGPPSGYARPDLLLPVVPASTPSQQEDRR